MRVLASILFLGLSSPAAAERAGRDYVTVIKTPVKVVSAWLVLDGGSKIIVLKDSDGREITVCQDFSHARANERPWLTYYAREPGSIGLGDLKDGRVLNYTGEEGTHLLEILKQARAARESERRDVQAIAEFIDKKRQKASKG